MGKVLRGKESSEPEAAAAAAKIRPLLDEYHKLAREAGLPGFEGDPVSNFFPRYWDDAKITQLSEEVSRETQGLWFKEALLRQWNELDPPVDTSLRREELARERAELDNVRFEREQRLADDSTERQVLQDRLTNAAREEQEAATYFAGFSPRQKGIGEARKWVTRAKQESIAAARALKDFEKQAKADLKDADKALRDFDEAAEQEIKFLEAKVTDEEAATMASLRTEIEELRARIKEDPKNEALRYDMRQLENELKTIEDPINKRIARGDTREADAERIGQAFVRAIHRRNLGVNDAMQHGIPFDEADRLNELFEGTGLTKAQIDEFQARLQALSEKQKAQTGKVRHGKGRLRFDETLEMEVATRTGGKRTLSIEDMTLSDAGKAIPRYIRTMSGWIALAKESNIRGQGDIDKIKLQAAETGASRDELAALDDAFKLITGRVIESDPSGIGSQYSRLALAWNYPRFGGSFGVAQLPEMGNIVGEVGFKNFLREIPDMADLVRRAADGTLDDATAREIDELIAAGTDYLTRPAQRGMTFEDGFAMTSKAAEKLHAGSQRLGRLTALTSLMTPINTMLERVAVRAIMRDWGDIAKGAKELSDSKRARLRGAGLSDEMQDRVWQSLRDHGTYTDGRLETANPHLWNDIEAADRYRMALDRERRQTIQRNEIGNTGSYVHKPVGRVLTQFMNFMLNSINKQLIRGVHYRDIQTFTSWGTSMFIGGVAYTAQTSIDFAADPDKRKERLEAKRIAAAAYQRAGFSAITVPLWDTTMTLAGKDPWFKFGRTSGLGTDFVSGNPTYSTAVDLLYTGSLPLRWALNEDYKFSQQDTERMQRLVPLQRTLGLRNAFEAIHSQLPERPSD